MTICKTWYTNYMLHEIEKIKTSPDRDTQRAAYTALCERIWNDFRWIFLFSAEWSLDFRNQSYEDVSFIEPKIGHWDYIDTGFLAEPANYTETHDIKKINELKGLWFINPEYLKKAWDGFWMQWWENSSSMEYLKWVIKRTRTIRFQKWHIGLDKPENIAYDGYDIGYAESSQCDPRVTCKELIKLVKAGWYIIMRQSYYDWKVISSPLRDVEWVMVTSVATSIPECGFDLFQKI